MTECVAVIQGSLSRLLEWLKNSPWESYDPYDYKGKPQVAWVLKKPLPARFLNYAGLCFPGLTRRLLKVSPTGTASGYAYLLSGFSRLASVRDNDAHRKLAQKALALLLESRIPGGGWGLPFDWQTSHAARIPKDTTLSYTTYTGLQALLDYGHYTGERQTLVLAGEIAHCTLNRLNRKGVDGGVVFSYSIYDQYEVINTNALLGAVFCQLGALLDDGALLALGRGMLKFVIDEQNPDGSWNYFSKRSYSSPRIDNYHSAMTLRGVLESLDYLEISQDKAREVVESGLRFYETEFLNERVFPALRPERSYPKDIACIAEGALVYEALLRYGWGDRDRLKDRMCALLTWAIRNMQKRDGRFLYRKYPLFGVDLKSIRWGQGMMLVALASAMAHLIPAARAVNDGMPLHVTELLINASSRAGIAIEDAKVAVLGYAYLKNSDDTRNSPSQVLVARLRELGATVVIHDPYVPEYKGDLEKVVQGCDAIVLMVVHDVYRSVDLDDLKSRVACPILIDGCHVFSMGHARTAGWDYHSAGLGRD